MHSLLISQNKRGDRVATVNTAKTKDYFERLCRCFGLEACGNAGWKILTSVGEASGFRF